VSLATLPDDDAPIATSAPHLWEQHGCPKKAHERFDYSSYDDRPRVFIGPMADASGHRALLQETTRATIAARRPDWRVEITEKASTEVTGFYLEGTVEDLDTNAVPNARSTIHCGVTFWLATDAGKRFAVTSGSAHVLTSRDQSDVALSRDACVQSVVEDLVENKLIEAIEHPSMTDLESTYR